MKAKENFEGTFTRMARMIFDQESGRMWLSYLQVDLEVKDLDTQWGPTRVTHAVDSVRVKMKKRGGNYSDPVNVSGGTLDAKLDPRIDAGNGRVCVTWCGCHPETRAWRIFAAWTTDGERWSEPIVVTGEKSQACLGGNGKTEQKSLALHPDVALGPDTNQTWIVYEDWADGSVKLIKFDGSDAKEPVKISESGMNFRPRVIVTRKEGKHRGSVAVAWDAYRGGQYDIYMRLLTPDGELGPEMRVTRSGRWDSCPDLIEDMDGNIWVAWVRASNQLSEIHTMRDIHVRFFDGEKWMCPAPPDILYNTLPFRRLKIILGTKGKEKGENMPWGHVKNPQGEENEAGRLTWYTLNWSPLLQVDRRNRVYVFYRTGDPLLPPLYNHLDYRVYEGDRWSKPRRIKLGRGMNLMRGLYDFTIAINDRDTIEGFWDQFYIVGKVLWSVWPLKSAGITAMDGGRFNVQGAVSEDLEHQGWPVQETIEPRPEIEINRERRFLVFGDTHTHSSTCDGADPTDHYFHFARDKARLDFFAVSNLAFFICNTPGVEAYLNLLPKIFTSNDFVCFHAYEFLNGAEGHRVVVFEGSDKPAFPWGMFNTQRKNQLNTTSQLYRFMHRFAESPEERVLITSHNNLIVGNDFTGYDESLEPLYDVSSLQIAAEKTMEEYKAEGEAVEDNNIIRFLKFIQKLPVGGKRSPENKWYSNWRQCLKAGLPLGAYGGSDAHCTNSVGWAMAGLWIREKSRKAIFDAMFERRSIALDNQLRLIDTYNTVPYLGNIKKNPPTLRMDIRFWLEGHFMGERCRIISAPTARAYVQSQDPGDPVKQIVFVKDGREVHTEKAKGETHLEALWSDDNWTLAKHYYYIRAELESGALGFSSPVFVNYTDSEKTDGR